LEVLGTKRLQMLNMQNSQVHLVSAMLV
jgi:hypothetical protein